MVFSVNSTGSPWCIDGKEKMPMQIKARMPRLSGTRMKNLKTGVVDEGSGLY